MNKLQDKNSFPLRGIWVTITMTSHQNPCKVSDSRLRQLVLAQKENHLPRIIFVAILSLKSEQRNNSFLREIKVEQRSLQESCLARNARDGPQAGGKEYRSGTWVYLRKEVTCSRKMEAKYYLCISGSCATEKITVS